LRGSRSSGVGAVILAGQVLLSRVRKEAALDLHSPFSTSHHKLVRLADRPLASPFLTFLPFASFELWPQQWGRFFWGRASAMSRGLLMIPVIGLFGPIKKTLSFAQNPENKGLDFFLAFYIYGS
jgi:hypothetical protein